MKKISSIILLSVALLFCNCSGDDDTILIEPTLKEQIAQMLMVGFRGVGPQLTEEMTHAIVDNKVGGVILFEIDAIKLANGEES